MTRNDRSARLTASKQVASVVDRLIANLPRHLAVCSQRGCIDPVAAVIDYADGRFTRLCASHVAHVESLLDLLEPAPDESCPQCGARVAAFAMPEHAFYVHRSPIEQWQERE